MRVSIRWTVLAAVLVAVSWTGVAGAARSDSDVTFVNKSSWDIYELYLSPSDDDEWGPDQLEEGVLESGGEFLLYSIPCDDYDVLLIDEDGDECILEEIDLCGDSEEWVITNKALLACEFGS
ncbi:MAG TPA: hypothetical protein VHQ65_15080 [Thermoanaerobaculia bacterium]|nr:hypothetical protein [Thermoanaerobaculia bacterium]